MTEQEALLQEDLEATHGLVNYLAAGLVGKQAFYNILSELQAHSFSSDELVALQGRLQKVVVWTQELMQDKPLVSRSWNKPQSDDSKAAIEIAEHLKTELLELAEKLTELNRLGDYASDPENVKLAVAAFARFAYTRHEYVRGFLRYAEHSNNGELSRKYSDLVPQAQYDLRLADAFVDALLKPDRPQIEYFLDVQDEMLILPGVFRTHIHDLNQLCSIFSGAFTFEDAEIPSEEASNWRLIQLTPEVAGYWRAYGIKPQDVIAWSRTGIGDPGIAGSCIAHGFTPKEALAWLQYEVMPRTAARWRDAGYRPEEAAQAIREGSPMPARKRRRAKLML